jgi:NADH-quinone oxidoreductase subunit H
VIVDLLENLGWFLLSTTVGKFLTVVMLFAMPLASVLTWMERRQSAYTQDRYGPQRAHFFTFRGKPVTLFGLLHIAADGLKMFFKEHFVPETADRKVFLIAPLFGYVTSLVILALIPFGPDAYTSVGDVQLQIARVDAGILFVFAVASLGIYGAALAGWASNNRFALLGGLRASAQQISYEIALGLTVVGVLIAYGSTELSQIVAAQKGTYGILPAWGVFLQPVGAVLFLIAAMAETKRVPFDLPEGESEIIGYFVEYSSMGFGLFMLGEFVEVVAVAALFVTLFLGGWQLPGVLEGGAVHLGFATLDSPWAYLLAGMAVFGIKVFFVCAFQLQLRWTLPRFRYDQLMRVGWKNLLPLALVNIFVTAILVWLDPSLAWLTNCGIAAIVLFFLVVIAGPRRRHAAHAPAHGH